MILFEADEVINEFEMLIECSISIEVNHSNTYVEQNHLFLVCDEYDEHVHGNENGDENNNNNNLYHII